MQKRGSSPFEKEIEWERGRVTTFFSSWGCQIGGDKRLKKHDHAIIIWLL
jgi:hypothetical protein